MRKPVVLITGAGGEIGHGLIDASPDSRPARSSRSTSPRSTSIAAKVDREITGSILDRSLLERILAEFEVELVFHLAALLSTRSEFTPVTAHQVNVEGTLNLLEFAQHEAESHGRPVVFLYPSSIAAYGLPDLATKARGRQGAEDEFNAADDDVRVQQAVLRAARPVLRAPLQAAGRRTASGRVDFRCVRFSRADLGGDGAVRRHVRLRAGDDPRRGAGEPYACFVRPDTRIPFMAMPDGVEALLQLAAAPRERLTRDGLQRRRVQPVGRGDPRAVLRAFPDDDHLGRRREAPGHRRLVAAQAFRELVRIR